MFAIVDKMEGGAPMPFNGGVQVVTSTSFLEDGLENTSQGENCCEMSCIYLKL